jgi:hypothetical protein
MSNAIILDNSGAAPSVTARNNSRIAHNNALSRATTVTSATDSANTANLYDNMTTTFWNPGTGTVDVDITLPSAEDIDCAAIAAGNWADASTTIEVYSDLGTTKVGEISGLKNGQPYLFTFDSVFISTMRIRFISTGDLNVGQVLFGESLKIPNSASIGMQPGKFNNNDKVIGQRTESNGLSANSTVARSQETIAPYKLVPISWIESDWVVFVADYKGKPIWFSWDDLNKKTDVTFGHWSTSRVKYSSSFFADLTLTVKGHV